VSALSFLTPHAADERAVLARSPMERLAAQAGGQLVRRQGWNVAAAYADPATERQRLTETVAFADRSPLFKLELQAPPDRLAALVAHAADGLMLEPGRAVRAAGAWWCPLTPARALVLGELEAAQDVRGALDGASDSVVDVTSALAGLSLLGPLARELLARFCAIDARPAVTPLHGFRPGSIARTPGYLLVEAPESLLILAGWALGEYLWRVVADAAEHLGGGPVGAEALARELAGA
jgi:glycine cleavage system aminomethyltransferase T